MARSNAEHRRAYRARHPDRPAASCRKWRENNRPAWLAAKRKHYAKNRQTIVRATRTRTLERLYGLTPSDIDAMLSTQGGVCPICGRDIQANSRLRNVDHDHRTNAVRALLCTSCNRGLGFFFEDTSLLEAAAAYLRQHGAVALPRATPGQGQGAMPLFEGQQEEE